MVLFPNHCERFSDFLNLFLPSPLFSSPPFCFRLLYCLGSPPLATPPFSTFIAASTSALLYCLGPNRHWRPLYFLYFYSRLYFRPPVLSRAYPLLWPLYFLYFYSRLYFWPPALSRASASGGPSTSVIPSACFGFGFSATGSFFLYRVRPRYTFSWRPKTRHENAAGVTEGARCMTPNRRCGVVLKALPDQLICIRLRIGR